MSILVFDLETIPNEDLLKRADIAMPPPSPADAPSNYGEDAAKKWAEKASLGHREKVLKRMSTDPVLGQICCIGTIMYDPITESRERTVYGIPLDSGDNKVGEKSILEMFWLQAAAADQFLGFNSHSFDAPFLAQRSSFLRVDHTPIDQESHVDLMRATSTRAYAGGYNNFSLQELRGWFGIPQMTTHTGADVYNDWLAGDAELIHEHCLDDVEATLDIALQLGVI